MLMGARVTMLPKNAKDRGAAKKVTQMIRKPRDRVFLGIAYNSEEKILVSHDYEDFQASKRVDIRRELSVAVIEADKGAERLLDRAAED
jgi:predicted nucleic acid-binding protein